MEHHVTTSVVAPPEAVWDLFVDVERWPEMTESISRLRRLDSGPLRVGSEAMCTSRACPGRNLAMEAQGFKRTAESQRPG